MADDSSCNARRRRALLKALGAAGIAAALPIPALGLSDLAQAAGGEKHRPLLAAARRAATWISQSRIQTSHGVTWPADPGNRATVNLSLYGGTPGVVLFHLELYHATGEARFLRETVAGADEIIARLRSPNDERVRTGLYEGLGGQLFMLCELSRVTGGERFAAHATSCIQRLSDLARRTGGGAQWNGCDDVVAGTAGTGLALLHAHRALQSNEALSLACQAGLCLLETGIAADGGLRWEMTPGFARYMPNFSHGTSGVAYFLAALFESSREPRFLDAALAAARHLESIAEPDGGCRIRHDDTTGRDLYYLGWCHGPVGTARLFHQLGHVTGEARWHEWVHRGALTLMQAGIPEQRTPGFWNNVSQCCGDAGVLQFFVDLHRVYGRAEYQEFSSRLIADILARATEDAAGSRWIQAESRTQPDVLIAQTGFMQGASGIGMALLHADAAAHGTRAHIVFPDSPFVERNE